MDFFIFKYMTFGGVDSAAFDTIAVATTQSALIVLTTYTLLDAVLTLAAPLPPEGVSFLLSLLNTKITETEWQPKAVVSKAEWKSGLRYYCYRNHSAALDCTNMDVFFGCDK